MSGPPYALIPLGGKAGQVPAKASDAPFDMKWIDIGRLLLTGQTASDGSKTWTFSPALTFNPQAVGLTLTCTQAARVRVAALSTTSCKVVVEGDTAAIAVAAGVKALSAGVNQPVSGATVTLELVPA